MVSKLEHATQADKLAQNDLSESVEKVDDRGAADPKNMTNPGKKCVFIFCRWQFFKTSKPLTFFVNIL